MNEPMTPIHDATGLWPSRRRLPLEHLHRTPPTAIKHRNPAHPLRLTGYILLLVAFFARPLASAAQTNDAPIEAQILYAPTAFEGSDHCLHLAYELHLTNFYDRVGPFTVKCLSVFGDTSTSPIATFSKEALITLLNSDEAAKADTDIVIQPGKHIVLFIWLALPLNAPPPHTLHHLIDFIDDSAETHSLAGATVHVEPTFPLTLGPPLRGHTWFVDEGPGNPKSHHWGSLLAENGIVTIPQRFAIDFIGLNSAAHVIEPASDTLNKTTNSQWIGYGSDVLAVQDAIVRDMRDSIPDHPPLSPLPGVTEITARGVYGNFVVLEIAPGIFAHYAHLQHGSIQVHIGQHVKKGDVIARLGDSGNAGGPHLHFQVSDKPTFELSEGLPYIFNTFDLLGNTDEGSILNPAYKFQAHPTPEKNVLPLHGNVVHF
jgi:Peptidase family M23